MGTALELVFILDAVFRHLGTDDFPGFAVDREMAHEFVVKLDIPEVFTLLDLLLGFGLVLFLARSGCRFFGWDEILVVIR